MELFGSEIFNDKKQIEETTKPENIHDEFMKPFDNESVIKNFKNPEILKKNFYNYIYSNIEFKNNLKYLVYSKNPYEEKDWKEGKKFDFCLTSDVSKWENYYASLIFTEYFDNKGIFEMHHRIVKKQSKNELGISGSDFLKKAEEYLHILKENNLLEIEKIQAKVSQFYVLSWLIKNNFNFNQDSKNSIKECFKNTEGNLLLDEKGIPILNDDYELIVMEDHHRTDKDSSGNYPEKDAYIIKKDFFANQKFEQLRKLYFKNGVGKNLGNKVLIYTGGRRGGHIVNDLNGAGVLPRFILEKEIK